MINDPDFLSRDEATPRYVPRRPQCDSLVGRGMVVFNSIELKTFFYDNGTPFAPRICHGKFAVTDARRGAEREPPRALLRTVRRHPWFGTVHGGPCPRDTRRALARRPCWDSHHGRRSAGAAGVRHSPLRARRAAERAFVGTV